VDFFEDELVRFGYDWKEVVAEYLFSGEEPVFNSIMADRELILSVFENAFALLTSTTSRSSIDPSCLCIRDV
jgi:hypothetical protein